MPTSPECRYCGKKGGTLLGACPPCLTKLYSQVKVSRPVDISRRLLLEKKGWVSPFHRMHDLLSPPRVLLTGSRHYADWEAVNDFLQEYPPDATFIVGDASGLDLIVRQLGDLQKLTVEVYKADWPKYGKSAGPLRNQDMLDKGKPTEVLAFPLPDSRGTLDMVKRAWRAGLPVRVWYEGREIDDVQDWVLQHYAVDLRRELNHQFLLAFGREATVPELADALRAVLTQE